MNSFDFPSGNPMSDGTFLSPFTGKLMCSHCGHIYRHRTISTKGRQTRYYRWICGAKIKYGSRCCAGPNVPETELERLACDVLGLEEFDEKICLEKISFCEADNQKIVFHFKDGSLAERPLPLTNKRLRVQTPEQRAHRSLIMAEIWRKRHEQHNSNSGNENAVCTCKESEC